MTFQVILAKVQFYFSFFAETLILSLPLLQWAGNNIDLPSNGNILKMVKGKITFIKTFLRNIQ